MTRDRRLKVCEALVLSNATFMTNTQKSRVTGFRSILAILAFLRRINAEPGISVFCTTDHYDIF